MGVTIRSKTSGEVQRIGGTVNEAVQAVAPDLVSPQPIEKKSETEVSGKSILGTPVSQVRPDRSVVSQTSEGGDTPEQPLETKNQPQQSPVKVASTGPATNQSSPETPMIDAGPARPRVDPETQQNSETEPATLTGTGIFKHGITELACPRKVRVLHGDGARLFRRKDSYGEWEYLRDGAGFWWKWSKDKVGDKLNPHLQWKFDQDIGLVK